MSEEKKKSELETLKENIVASAAEVVLAQMTPKQMRRIAEEVIEDVLSSLRTDRYGPFGHLLEQRMTDAVKEHLASDEIRMSIQVAVRQGVDAAIQAMPERVKGEVIDVAVRGMVEALQSKQSRRY